ncbi:MAG: M48 family metallopeptidase [Elusimicrobia bacterium]|jgi:STE24 endopeptidase|nr:M48 family metallopeptidase [Elusimicrobiota bacterium]
MNPYLIFILCVIAGGYIFKLVIDILNLKRAGLDLPDEFRSYYDNDKYKDSQRYLKDNTKFSLIKSGFFSALIILLILSGGFNYIDIYARRVTENYLFAGLIFFGIITAGQIILNLPFSIYLTFVIEQKYGFNRTAPVTFISDILKSLLLTVIIGGSLLSAVLWFFTEAGSAAWIYCWLFFVAVQIFLLFIAPVTILPLFNRFEPLKNGELKEEITRLSDKVNFRLQGIYSMDGSKRTSKANAFFTGFGKYKKIALFDTLISKFTTSELVSVLAHEIGHYKKKHIIKNLFFSVFSAAIMFWLLSFFIDNPGLFNAFGMDNISVYAGLFFFSFLYGPVDTLFSIGTNYLSRKHEYEADRYAVENYGRREYFIEALKKLSVDNLSNLTPHPAAVVTRYSHPPVLNRINRLSKD